MGTSSSSSSARSPTISVRRPHTFATPSSLRWRPSVAWWTRQRASSRRACIPTPRTRSSSIRTIPEAVGTQSPPHEGLLIPIASCKGGFRRLQGLSSSPRHLVFGNVHDGPIFQGWSPLEALHHGGPFFVFVSHGRQRSQPSQTRLLQPPSASSLHNLREPQSKGELERVRERWRERERRASLRAKIALAG